MTALRQPGDDAIDELVHGLQRTKPRPIKMIIVVDIALILLRQTTDPIDAARLWLLHVRQTDSVPRTLWWRHTWSGLKWCVRGTLASLNRSRCRSAGIGSVIFVIVSSVALRGSILE
jgi:hypothetical protein